MKNLLFVFIFVTFKINAQFNSSLPLINPPEDCPIAMRICDATQEYSFQLTSWGIIDDANGMLYLAGLSQSAPTRFESRVAWLKFTPQYSGQFGWSICPETPENYQFQLWTNPNCNDFHVVNYITPGTTMAEDIVCKGVGLNPQTNMGGDSWLPYINLTAGNTYIMLVLTRSINQVGTHRFTLKFTGQLIQDHPDVFNHPECTMSAEDQVKPEEYVSVYPNPFTDSFAISSPIAFEKVVLYDVLGKQIHAQNYATTISVKNLNQGVYFLHLINAEGKKVVRKIVKE